MSKPRLEPSAKHPITITPDPAHVVVRVGDTVVADSTSSLRLQEASYPAIHYVPLADVDESVLRPSDTTSYCPFKGDAGYYSVASPGGDVQDAMWFYEEPFPAVKEIAGHVAFYADRVSVTVEDAAGVA